jgi:Family of unknown function (DUF6230)
MTALSTIPPAGPVQGRVRWRRFAAIFIPAFLAIVVMFFLVAQGVLGASFAVSGQQFTVTANKLSGTGFEQFGSVDATKDGTHIPVIVSAIGSANLDHLCQSVALPGGIFLLLKAGGSGTAASASNLVVDSVNATGTGVAQSGDASFSNINIGQDASTLNSIGGGFNPQDHANIPLAGTFGQQADSVTINNLRQTAVATTAGTFNLPGLTLGFSGGGC